MLGTIIGRVCKNGYSAIDKTSFGADSSDKLSFFTGKPYVEDLGYTFLLRNYRADMGKWLSQDLIGYPDGWNNFAYCNNQIISLIDLYGAYLDVRKNEAYGTVIKSEIIGTRKISEDSTSITYEDIYQIYYLEKYDYYNVEKCSDILSGISSGFYDVSIFAGVATVIYSRVPGGSVVAIVSGVVGGVSNFISWLASKGNEEIETYLKSEEIRTNEDIFTETRVIPKEQGE